MAKYKIEVNRTNNTIAKGKLSFYIDGVKQFTTHCWENPTNLIKAKKYTGCSTTEMDTDKKEAVYLPNEQTGKEGIFIHQGSKPEDSKGCIVCTRSRVLEIYNEVPRNKHNIDVVVNDPVSLTETFDAEGRPSKSLLLGYVNLGEDTSPVNNKAYAVLNASDNAVGQVDYPKASKIKKLDLTLHRFWNQDLKDLGHSNEGLMKLSMNTLLPQDGRTVDTTKPLKKAEYVQEFEVRDGDFAPTFLNKAVYRNLLFEDFVNLSVDLIELDQGAIKIIDKFNRVLADVPELKNIDIIKSQPYIGLSAKLIKGLVMNFSPNDPNDHFWGEVPILELEPGPAGVFLRRGIYIILQEKDKNGNVMAFDNLSYKNGKLFVKGTENITSIANYLVFSINIKESDLSIQ